MRRNRILLIATILLIAALTALQALFGPRLSVHVGRQAHFVGPDDAAVSLLLSGAPLAEIQKAVAGSGKGVDDIQWMGQSLLCWAADKKRIDVAEWLLANGANPNGIEHGEAPLVSAIENNDVPMVKLLLKWGADPDLRIPIGETGIDMTPRWIASRSHPEITAALPRSTKAAANSAGAPQKSR